MGERGSGKKTALRPCRCCGGTRWRVWFSWTGCHVTAYAVCEHCDALCFSSGEDGSESSALESLCVAVSEGRPPYYP